MHTSGILPGSTWEKAGAMLPAGGTGTGARTCDRSGIDIKRPPVGYSAGKASTLGTAHAVSARTHHAAFIVCGGRRKKKIKFNGVECASWDGRYDDARRKVGAWEGDISSVQGASV